MTVDEIQLKINELKDLQSNRQQHTGLTGISVDAVLHDDNTVTIVDKDGRHVTFDLSGEKNKNAFSVFNINGLSAIRSDAPEDVVRIDEGLGIKIDHNSAEDTITISAKAIEAETLGTGHDIVKSSDLEGVKFRSIAAKENIIIQTQNDEIQIASVPVAENTGLGAKIYHHLSDEVKMLLRTIQAGVGIDVEQTENEIIIKNKPFENLGVGAGVYQTIDDISHKFRCITGGTNVVVEQLENEIKISIDISDRAFTTRVDGSDLYIKNFDGTETDPFQINLPYAVPNGNGVAIYNNDVLISTLQSGADPFVQIKQDLDLGLLTDPLRSMGDHYLDLSMYPHVHNTYDLSGVYDFIILEEIDAGTLLYDDDISTDLGNVYDLSYTTVYDFGLLNQFSPI